MKTGNTNLPLDIKTEENYINTICISLILNQTNDEGNAPEKWFKIDCQSQEMHLEAGKYPKSQRLAVFEFNNYSR